VGDLFELYDDALTYKLQIYVTSHSITSQ